MRRKVSQVITYWYALRLPQDFVNFNDTDEYSPTCPAL